MCYVVTHCCSYHSTVSNSLSMYWSSFFIFLQRHWTCGENWNIFSFALTRLSSWVCRNLYLGGWLLACIQTGFTNAGLSLAGLSHAPELTPRSCWGFCVSWGNTRRTPWEEPVLLKELLCHLGFVRSMLFCVKEKKWCLCFLNSCICLLLSASSLATWWQLLNSVMWTVGLLPICIALVSTFRIQQNTNIKREYNLL